MPLKKSKFRSKFKLTEKHHDYVSEKGIDTIQEHAYQFVNARVAPDFPKNDGKQTLMRGHPVFMPSMQRPHVVGDAFRNGME
jgi:hypothetical protein